MPKIERTKNKKKHTLHKPGIEAKKELMMIFIPLILLMDLSGLKIRKVRKILSAEYFSRPGTKSMIEITTTKKSSLFQPSLR